MTAACNCGLPYLVRKFREWLILAMEPCICIVWAQTIIERGKYARRWLVSSGRRTGRAEASVFLRPQCPRASGWTSYRAAKRKNQKVLEKSRGPMQDREPTRVKEGSGQIDEVRCVFPPFLPGVGPDPGPGGSTSQVRAARRTCGGCDVRAGGGGRRRRKLEVPSGSGDTRGLAG